MDQFRGTSIGSEFKKKEEYIRNGFGAREGNVRVGEFLVGFWREIDDSVVRNKARVHRVQCFLIH